MRSTPAPGTRPSSQRPSKMCCIGQTSATGARIAENSKEDWLCRYQPPRSFHRSFDEGACIAVQPFDRQRERQTPRHCIATSRRHCKRSMTSSSPHRSSASLRRISAAARRIARPRVERSTLRESAHWLLEMPTSQQSKMSVSLTVVPQINRINLLPMAYRVYAH